MTGAAAALVLAMICGWPLARRLESDHVRAVGLATLLGPGMAYFALLLLSILGIRWSLWTATGAAAALAILPLWGRRQGDRRDLAVSQSSRSLSPVDVVTAGTIAGYTLFATISPPTAADFINNWGLKARVFHATGSIDWAFLRSPWYDFWIHPDYPLLLPLTFDWLALFSGGWNEQWFGLLHTAMAIGVLLIARSLLADELRNRHLAALGTLMLAPLVVAPLAGLADTPLAVYFLAGVLYIRSGRTTTGALLLGLAAATKNEGLTFIVATAAAMLLDRRLRSDVVRLWPAVAIAAPWLVLRSLFALQTDVIAGSAVSRVVSHLPEVGSMFRLILVHGGWQPLFWTGLALALLIRGVDRRGSSADAGRWRTGALDAVAGERFALGVVVLQFAFYLAAYLATPYTIEWHVKWSIERIIGHLTPVLAYVAAARVLSRRGAEDEDGATPAASEARVQTA